ncbi:MAG: hypothetical protein NW207_09570, partial [Cytophagales bacterium]|nr:hypothetical protein [Cytophagales bacterium]
MKKYYMLVNQILYILIFILVHTLSHAQTCTPTSIPYPAMGMNFGNAAEMPWINLYHQLNESQSEYRGFALDPDGWTKSGQINTIVIGMDVSTHIPIQGVVKIIYKGTINQLITGTTTPGYNGLYTSGSTGGSFVTYSQYNYPSPGYSYHELNVPNAVSGNGNQLIVVFNGRVEDIKILRPGFDITDNRTLHPAYTSLIQNFSTIRYMEYMHSNVYFVNNGYDCVGPLSQDWSSRYRKNAPQCMEPSWEIMVDIANDLNKDMWINIPVIASDDYVLNLAHLLKDKLKPNLNINYEIGNEVWNYAGGFCCFKQIGYKGENVATFSAKRIKQINDIFATVWGWGEINNRIRPILAGQYVYGLWPSDVGRNIQPGLEYLENTFGPGTVKKHIYAIAGAPYWGSSYGYSDVNSLFASTDNLIDNIMFGEFDTELWNGWKTGNKFENLQGLAGYYGVKLYAYETGPDYDKNNPHARAASLDPRMRDRYKKFLTKYYGRYGYLSLINHFQGTIFNSLPSNWYLVEDINVKSQRLLGMEDMITNPAPAFDSTFRHVIPGTFVGGKHVGYMENWTADKWPLRKSWPGSSTWIFAAKKNGIYSLALEHNNGDQPFRVDIYIDGVKTHSNLSLPRTQVGSGYEWSNLTHSSGDAGINLNFNLSYGVHAIRIDYLSEGYGVDNTWPLGLRTFNFTLQSELPPFIPSPVIGDLNSCTNQPDAKYSVPVDQSACEYKWVGLPPTASINPDAGGPGTGIPRSGANTNLIYVNWGTTPNGVYNMTVFGINNVGTSPGRAFSVTVTTCGFTMTPNPVCTNTGVTLTPVVPGAVNYNWTFGFGGNYSSYSTTSAGILPISLAYTVPGPKTISLVVTLSGGSTKTFIQNLNVSSSPTIGSITPSNQSACSGGNAVLSVAGTGSSFQWLYSTDGGATYNAYPGATLPRFTFAGLSGTTLFKASVTNMGCPTLTTPGTATASIS